MKRSALVIALLGAAWAADPLLGAISFGEPSASGSGSTFAVVTGLGQNSGSGTITPLSFGSFFDATGYSRSWSGGTSGGLGNTATAAHAYGNANGGASASASLSVEDVLSVNGSVGANAFGQTGADGSVSVNLSLTITVNFTITERSVLHFSSGSGTVNGPVVMSMSNAVDLVLDPGFYTVSRSGGAGGMASGGQSFSNSGGGSFAFTVAVPGPGGAAGASVVLLTICGARRRRASHG